MQVNWIIDFFIANYNLSQFLYFKSKHSVILSFSDIALKFFIANSCKQKKTNKKNARVFDKKCLDITTNIYNCDDTEKDPT